MCVMTGRGRCPADVIGCAVGDQLLAGVAQRMRGMVREADLLARMGGYEFAIAQLAAGQPSAAASWRSG